MRGLVLVGVVGLAGCDRVFGLERPYAPIADAEADSSIDAAEPPTDGGIPAGTCWNPLPVPPQKDEDADTILDNCDNCPARANLDQVDGDRDGIGDVCDPHPALAIERLAYFDGFNALAPGKAFGGQWVWNGSSGLDQNGLGGYAVYVLTTPMFRRPTVDLQYVNGVPSTATNEWQFGGLLIDDVAGAADPKPDALRCSEQIYQTVTDDVLLDRFVGGANVATGRGSISTGSGGTTQRTVRMSYDRITGDPTCTIVRTTATGTATLVRAAGDGERVGVGLITRLAQLTFQNVTVYETVWPPE